MGMYYEIDSSPVQLGHCQCCCGKWEAVERSKPLGVYKFAIVWMPKNECSCAVGHATANDEENHSDD